MRKAVISVPLIVFFLANALPVVPASGGEPPQKKELSLSSAVSPLDWGLSSAEAIRGGELTMVRQASGDVLNIRFLSKEIRSGRKGGSKPAAFNGDYFLVSNFVTPPPHSLGGNFGAFQGAPSTAQLEVGPGTDGMESMVLTAQREKDGWCGAWVHLIETNGEPLTREYLNGGLFSHLVFWVRGTAAGPEANIKLADAAWQKREDSVAIGPIASFVPSKKIEPHWQLAAIPLEALPGGLDRKNLGTFVIEFVSPGAYRLEVKGLALANHPDSLPVEPPKPRTDATAAWVWNTEQVMSSRAEQNALLTHLAAEGINLIYMNIPFKFGSFAFDETEMGGLMMLLRQKGIETAALLGDKELALSRNHAFVKNAIKGIIDFNSRVAAQARFSGIQLDIEAHLLPGFYASKRGDILAQYLRILSDAAGLARSGRLSFGVDIPSWFDQVEPSSGGVMSADLSGRTKPVYEHVIDLCDRVNVGVRRTSTGGVEGIMAQAVGELAYASRTGKKIYVGLETRPVEGERVFTFRGAPAPDPFSFPNAPFFICLSGAAEEMTINVLEPSAAADLQGRLSDTGKASFWWPVYLAPEIPSAAVSFALLGGDLLKLAMAQTAGELSVYPSFAGIAVNDFSAHRRLLGSQR
ncbi:MAG: hypothetical protein JW843_12425 [Candidatus Aminicenantes bacterium]|nr:hypothetical protein [Candidatus Aminicenantes bacterium]